MLKCINLIISLFFFLLSVFSFSQKTIFRNFGVNDGLPGSEVYSVMQDSRGYMWFSTDRGVCHYDGYLFKTYTTADGLADNTVFESIEDYKGRIWFRSLTGKISYFYNDSIFSLPVNEKLTTILKNATVTSLVADSMDNIYVGAYMFNEILKIDLRHNSEITQIPVTNSGSYIAFIPHAKSFLNGSSAINLSMLESRNEYIILSLDSLSSKELKCYKQFSWKIEKPSDKKSRIHDEVIKLSDAQLAVSLGTKFIVIENNKITFMKSFDASILRMNFDNYGNVWIALQNEAPVSYSNGAIHELPEFATLMNRQITCAYRDVEKGIWLSSLNDGVYYLNSLDFITWTDENGLPGNKVNFLGIASDSSIWITTLPGKFIAVLKDGKFTYRNVENLTGEYPSINCLLFHRSNRVWVSCGLGLYVYKNDKNFDLEASKSQTGGKDLIENKDGTVWLNELSKISLYIHDNKSLKEIQHVPLESKIEKLCPGANNDLWIGTLNGLWNYDNERLLNWGIKYPVLKKRIDDIKISDNGDVWVATRDTGIIIITSKGLRYVTNKNGLPSNFCDCLYFDYKGNIWAGSNMGISHFFVHYDNDKSLIIDSIKNISTAGLKEVNCILGIQDKIYAGTNNGLTFFDMEKLSTNLTPPPVHISNITINNKELSSSLRDKKLRYDENNVVINYIGLTYQDPAGALYRYRLQGLDTGWTYTRFTSARFPKLPPGDYKFIVSARNNDGIWSRHEALVTFNILPPFWNTWWARIALILISGLVIYWQITVIKKREERKSESRRLLATMELRELRAQMDPHFLFNNLNTLTFLVENKSEDAVNFVEALSKYYRYSIQYHDVEFIALKDELEQAERYVSLLKIRFRGQLNVIWKIDENKKMNYISSHSLQSLMENITKHNSISSDSPLGIEINTTDDNSLLVINELHPKKGELKSTGFGLKNIDERYRILCGKRIKISSTSNYFTVELPLLTPREYESIAHRR